MTLPLGFCFRPTDEELIFEYLLRKVRGEGLPWDGIPEFDIYGDKAPSQIFGDLGGREEEKYYLFTRIKKFSKRVVGHGSSMKKTDWIMHEFSLSGDLLEREQELSNTWVLCTVNKKVTETRRGVKRCYEDVQSPCPISAITTVEVPTPFRETPLPKPPDSSVDESNDEYFAFVFC
ncbi:NAC domain-containing protein 41-like [Corylus avellana]|uniref:NAC domain-containing protein 41-like n=1 Tax=Corylus avellana TaxID=13451 RepID=UPI00286A13D6|nr:NAC domain-containing protein 41-like [Corylus avellana]